jgi:hypothetical protein
MLSIIKPLSLSFMDVCLPVKHMYLKGSRICICSTFMHSLYCVHKMNVYMADHVCPHDST